MTESNFEQHTVTQCRPPLAEWNPDIFAQSLPAIPYMMPAAMLPIKDCSNCQWHQESWRDGCFCYMFRVEPDGEKCGQMNRVSEAWA